MTAHFRTLSGEEGPLHIEREGGVASLVCLGYFDERFCVLVVEDIKRGGLTLPSGAIKTDEHYSVAASREAGEEVGYEPPPDELCLLGILVKKKYDEHSLYFQYFLGDIASPERLEQYKVEKTSPTVGERHWVPLDELPEINIGSQALELHFSHFSGAVQGLYRIVQGTLTEEFCSQGSWIETVFKEMSRSKVGFHGLESIQDLCEDHLAQAVSFRKLLSPEEHVQQYLDVESAR